MFIYEISLIPAFGEMNKCDSYIKLNVLKQIKFSFGANITFVGFTMS